MDPLIVNFQDITKKPIELASLPLGIGRQIIPWKTKNYRSPWEHIPETHRKGCNLSFNLNIDPDITDFENTKKWQIPKVLLFFEELKLKHIIQKVIIVYEWGKFGKAHGTLHFHGMVKTQDRFAFEKAIFDTFNKRTNLRHRTLKTKIFKDVEHRDHLFNVYYRKETHNKIKCLYWN